MRPPGHVDDGRPGELVERDLRPRERLQALAHAERAGVEGREGEARRDRDEDDAQAERVSGELAPQVERGRRAQKEREKRQGEAP